MNIFLNNLCIMCFDCLKKKDKERLIKNLYWCMHCSKYFKTYKEFKKHMDNHNLNII